MKLLKFLAYPFIKDSTLITLKDAHGALIVRATHWYSDFLMPCYNVNISRYTFDMISNEVIIYLDMNEEDYNEELL